MLTELHKQVFDILCVSKDEQVGKKIEQSNEAIAEFERAQYAGFPNELIANARMFQSGIL